MPHSISFMSRNHRDSCWQPLYTQTHPTHTYTDEHSQGYQCSLYKPKKFNFANDKRQRLLQITKPQNTHTAQDAHTHTCKVLSLFCVCVAVSKSFEQPQIAGVQTLITFLLGGRVVSSPSPRLPLTRQLLLSHQNLIGSFRSRLTSVKHTHKHTHT